MNRRVLQTIFVVVAVIASIALAVWDWREVSQVVSHADGRLFVPVVLMAAGSYACLSVGFAVVCRLFGIRVARGELSLIGFVSAALNHMSSSAGLAGLTLRVLMTRRENVSVTQVISASILYSYCGALVLMSLLPIGVGYLVVTHRLQPGHVETVFALLAALAAGSVAVTITLCTKRARAFLMAALTWLVAMVLRRRVGSQLAEFDHSLALGIQAMRKHPGKTALFLLLVLGDWLLAVATLGYCFAALGGALPLSVLLAGFSIGIISGVVSFIPGGVGVQEGSMSVIFALLGVQVERAALAAVLFRFAYDVLPFFVSLAFYGKVVAAARSKQIDTP